MTLESNPILKIHKFTFLVEKLFDRELTSKFKISFSQFRVMSVINENPGISQKNIAGIQDTTEACVSRHIDVLYKMRYIALTTNSNNRKEHNLYLTAKGKVLFKKANTFVDKRADTILKKISSPKKSELYNTFDILLQSVHR